MYFPRFALAIFEGSDKKNVFRSRLAIERLLDALVLINMDWLRAYPETPKLYESGVVYKKVVPPGEDDDPWQDIPSTLSLGYGDCEDLACWRVAELRMSGNAASTLVDYRLGQKDGKPRHFFHVLVQYQNGSTEDPSRLLGAKGL